MFRAAEKKLQLEAEVVGEESTYASLAGAAKSKKGNKEANTCAGWIVTRMQNQQTETNEHGLIFTCFERTLEVNATQFRTLIISYCKEQN